MKNLNKEYLDRAKKIIPGISQLFGKKYSRIDGNPSQCI